MASRGSMGESADQFVRAMLRSPFHSLVSNRSLLITVCGKKTGRPYTLPVNYWQRGDLITIVSLRRRKWWRNLRGGAPVTLRLNGRMVKGQGSVIEDENGVCGALAAAFSGVRRPPRRYRDVEAAAKTRVMVQVQLELS